jgi:hypothetical protein
MLFMKSLSYSKDYTMRKNTQRLFELSLLIFAFYSLLNYSGNQRLLVSFACLVGVFLVDKLEIGSGEKSDEEEGVDQGEDLGEIDDEEKIARALDCLLKRKNVLLLTDAINYLMQDLGLTVSPSPDRPDIDRLVKLPGKEVTFGLKIIGDVGDLDQNWDKLEELVSFDMGKGGKQRLLIIGSNYEKEARDKSKEYKNFSTNSKELLSASKVIAMTTLTLHKIYLACKLKKPAIEKVFHSIQQHPGGVIQIQ